MGYMNKFLEINLTENKFTEKKLSIDLAKKFIGGKGLGAKILYDSITESTDPLSPENLLLFMTGPLSGSRVQTSGRWTIVTKSPQTGTFLDSHIGGRFGYRLKTSGYDFLKIKGKASEPSFLIITDNGYDLKPAKELWGKGTYETEEVLKKKYEGSEVASIGPAGENSVAFANIMTDRTHMAGRGGSGAVMGSKNLKAVVVQGNSSINAVYEEKFKKLTTEFTKKVKNNPGVQKRHEIGTVMWVKMSNDNGFLPTRNFKSGYFDQANKISGERMRDEYVIGHTACYRCIIACGKTTKFTEGKYAGLEVDGPEYETSALLGASCGLNSLDAIAKANELCDDLGMDTITTGGTIAFAMDAVEKGYLIPEDVSNLNFGNDDAVMQLINLISKKQGTGELLSKGSRYAAQQVGHNSEDFAIQVKGLELAGVEPRGSWGMALAYSTADRGACHQRCWTPGAELSGALPRFSFEGVPKFVKESQDERAACYSLVLCDFLPFDVPEMVDMLNAATGFDFTPESYLTTGERIWNQTRLFNVREGFSRKDDKLPERFFTEKLPDGSTKGQILKHEEFNLALSEYYALRGWNEQGVPSSKKREVLDL